MKLKNEQAQSVKVTITKYPFNKGDESTDEDPKSKSFTVYDSSVLEVDEFLRDCIENAVEDSDD